MEQTSRVEGLTEAEEAAEKGKMPGETLVLSLEAISHPALSPQSSGETLADDVHTYHVRDWGINE